jgi:hypothetical protein
MLHELAVHATFLCPVSEEASVTSARVCSYEQYMHGISH